MVTTLKKTNKKGFTLVELVIVIAILAILAAIAVPTVSNVITTANTNTDAANCQTIELALKSAHAEATAKTWDVDADTITVPVALKHEGLDLTTLQSGIKTGTGTNKVFYYAKAVTDTDTTASGKIYVSAKSGEVSNILLTVDTKVSDYIKGIETKK
jgi:type IV pilus assembly protein PilA